VTLVVVARKPDAEAVGILARRRLWC